jgi:hypothetical protein
MQLCCSNSIRPNPAAVKEQTMSYAERLKFAAACAGFVFAAATFAAEPVADSPAKSQATENSADTRLAANGRTAPTNRAVPGQDKGSKVRPAYCREPQQWYYYDQTPGELSDCQK